MILHITEKALNEFIMPAGKKKVLVHDQEQTGFAVSVTHNGTMSYVISYRDVQGAQRQERLAGVGDVSANAARAMARARLADIAATKGQTVGARRSSCPTMDSFFFDTFLPHVQNTSRSYETHASIYRNHIQPVFGNKRLDDVSGQDIIDFNTLLRSKTVAGGKWKTQADKRLANGTVKRILILVRHIFNVAIEDKSNVIKENPTHALELTTARNVKGKFLTAAQLGALLRAAEESENESLADIIRVMGGTGLRRENVLAMEWAWFDEARGTLTVPTESDKAKKGFVLHVSTGVLEVLRMRSAVATGPWVFPNPKTGKPYYSCYDAWVTARNKANLPGLRMHDLRHTYASMMLESGSDIVDVQHALGHTQLKTTAVYLHLTEGRKRAHANAAADATGLFA
ncbi:site-specific integrase [Cupriavidus necator]|uniref:Site-specific integrase n=1 Tax=Cupriavidus necator TaxID=106590 RepID=A0A1U9UUM4_CUPNE|nr:site-specific integrase [Cupriavidus necator]AQV96394.1 site-specific integrase [Cupriavidus necator]